MKSETLMRVTQPGSPPSFAAQYHSGKTHHLLRPPLACTLSGIEPTISVTLETEIA